MGLAFVPCVDGDLSHVHDNNTPTETVIHQSNHDHQGELCTPFCSCQCCQIQLTFFDFPEFAPISPVRFVEVPLYRLEECTSFPSAFFQPPQV